SAISYQLSAISYQLSAISYQLYFIMPPSSPGTTPKRSMGLQRRHYPSKKLLAGKESASYVTLLSHRERFEWEPMRETKIPSAYRGWDF
ncbi:MAG: hypothetical protein AAB343_01170, partial [Patescibacteria group bacterium]